MKNLKYFISGIVFYILCIPIIESIAEIITTYLEVWKGKVTISVLKMNKDIAELQVDLEKHDEGVAIGFQAPDEDYYEDDDDFEDKKKSKLK